MAIELGAKNPANANAKKPAAQLWLNVGFTTKNSEGEETFISLPMGIPLDTMDPAKVTGRDPEYRQMVQAKNELLELLKKAGVNVEAGKDEIISDLQVQIRRVGTVDETPLAENCYAGGLKQLSFARAS